MKHILVIRLSALGDAAIAAPIVAHVAAANTDILFTVAAPPRLAPLFEGLDNVKFKGINKRQSFWRLYRDFRSVGADAVADLHQVNRIIGALHLLRCDHLLRMRPLPIAHIDKGRRSRRRFLNHIDMYPRRPQWQRYADVFRKLGLEVPDIDSSLLTVKPTERPVIGFAPFAAFRGKTWPTEFSDKLISLLSARGYRVCLFGGPADTAILEEWQKKYNNVESLAAKLSFREELDAIAHLSLMVCMDSANMHFASAVGTPVVSIWGATHPDFGFYGFRQDRTNALCANLPCQPCSAFGQRPCRYGDYRCLQAIRPEQVLNHIEERLSKSSLSNHSN